MPPERLTPGQWMHNTKELRDYLAKVFSVPQSKATEIRDQDILSDGRSYEDLAVITKETLCAYIGSEETFMRAWEVACAKGWSELHPPVATIQPVAAKVVEEVPPSDALTEKDIADATHAKKIAGE